MRVKPFYNANGNCPKATTIIELANGDELLIHYETPVAGFISGKGYVRSEQFHSVTTSKHVNYYCGGKGEGIKVEQDELDNLYASI